MVGSVWPLRVIPASAKAETKERVANPERVMAAEDVAAPDDAEKNEKPRPSGQAPEAGQGHFFGIQRGSKTDP